MGHGGSRPGVPSISTERCWPLAAWCSAAITPSRDLCKRRGRGAANAGDRGAANAEGRGAANAEGRGAANAGARGAANRTALGCIALVTVLCTSGMH